MSGIQFLFEFQSRKDAEHIIRGSWKREGKTKFGWWSPTVGACLSQHRFKWFWIHILGLPLHLWSAEIMKEIGDKSGGWLATEEEPSPMSTTQSERSSIHNPRKVELTDGDLIFSFQFGWKLQ